ncbi:MAG: hypothetical protein WC565_09255, partial [Parcubacteria group bacterium]
PGDWVDVGKQTALAWVASGQAKAIGAANKELFNDCGILVREPAPSFYGPVPMTIDRLQTALLYPKNMIWDGKTKMPPHLLAVGFNLLETWEAAIPLLSYEQLAASVGADADRQATLAAVRDLRVLLYEPGLMFLRDCPACHQLLERWKAERNGGDAHLAFLRALYATPLLVCALPTTWLGKGEPE